MNESGLLIQGAYLWDGLKEKASPNVALLVENGRIKAVGSTEELSGQPQTKKIQWPGATIIPGLIDSHNHLSMDATMENYLDRMSDPVPELTLRAHAMMSKDLLAGVTSMRCLGDKEFLDVACKQDVEEGLIDGPKLLIATRGIRAPDGPGFVGYPFKGAEEIRRAINQNLQAGADLIKIYITGTLKGEGDLPSYLTKKEIQVACDEAHRSDVRIAAHCVGGEGLDWALEAGLDTVEHGYHITLDQIAQLANSKSWLVLTPSPFMDETRIRHLPPALIPGHLAEMAEVAQRMAATIDSDLVYGVGTDGVHAGLAREIRFLIALGASNRRALQAATIHGAVVCGIEKDTGSLEVGKFADLIALSGNPLEDSSVLDSPVAVMKQGRLVVDPELESSN